MELDAGGFERDGTAAADVARRGAVELLGERAHEELRGTRGRRGSESRGEVGDERAADGVERAVSADAGLSLAACSVILLVDGHAVTRVVEGVHLIRPERVPHVVLEHRHLRLARLISRVVEQTQRLRRQRDGRRGALHRVRDRLTRHDSRNASGDARGRHARTLQSVDERPSDVSRAHRYPARVRVSLRWRAPGDVRASTVPATLPPDVDARRWPSRWLPERRTLIRRIELFPLRNVLPTGQTVWRISRSERGFARGGESTAQTPRGAPRQKPRESAERPNVPTENAVRFRARGCESIASEDFLFRAAKILNPPRFRPSTCPNRRNSTRAARFCYHYSFERSCARSRLVPDGSGSRASVTR